MVNEHTLIKFGLIKDEGNSKLKEAFKDSTSLKEIHIDTYAENPLVTSTKQFMLLLRLIEKNMMVSNDGNRLILKKVVDKFETHFMSVLFSEIIECYYKGFDDCSEFILNIQNIYYRIIIYS